MAHDIQSRYRVHHATLGSDMPPSDIVIGLEYRGHSFQDVMRRVIDLTGIPYFETAMATRIGIIASGRTINLDGEKVFPNSYGLDRLFPLLHINPPNTIAKKLVELTVDLSQSFSTWLL